MTKDVEESHAENTVVFRLELILFLILSSWLLDEPTFDLDSTNAYMVVKDRLLSLLDRLLWVNEVIEVGEGNRETMQVVGGVEVRLMMVITIFSVFLRSPSVRCVAESSTSDPEFVENVWNPAVAVMPLRTCLSEKYTKLLPSYKWVNDDESWVSKFAGEANEQSLTFPPSSTASSLTDFCVFAGELSSYYDRPPSPSKNSGAYSLSLLSTAIAFSPSLPKKHHIDLQVRDVGEADPGV
ncbi:hypothetical protein L6452_35106 [Arctium lappa]|uniref:Uncharacterized protein n=1 Tax=Arctium lappa TaxID=4217 RepID=A0ACB8YL90_ARCLA|nr:hypothetical protein L6452_35106 [Arctium lappa]